ncbi:MAG TPA: thioredoxin family protein [Bdellovibrionales bacterium]|nr:thioredoxin family protein [Pseudobdellovibrionaceae bacterium]HAG91136.1 thioredoxin family protein [Bdellovibrionales bacterium]|tara:strand:- start:1283 stop:1894 length:612 start_codon:yes stop_codon:yes gene_type:complete
MKNLILGLLFVFGSSTFAKVNVGDKAPDFSLMGHDGKVHSLKEDLGSYVVLEWYNPGCPYVKKHYNSKNMQNLQKEIQSLQLEGKAPVIWYSISSSNKGKQGHMDVSKAAKNYSEKGLRSKAILLDSDGKVGKAYGATTTPHMFIVNAKGLVIYEGAIDDQPSANKKTLKGAKNYIRMAFEDLEKGNSVKVASTNPYGCSVKY